MAVTHEGTEHELIFTSEYELRRARDRMIALDIAKKVGWLHGDNMYLIQEEP